MKSYLLLIAIFGLMSYSLVSNAQDAPTHRLHLKSGGEILGQLINDSKSVDGRAHIVFKTQSGGTMQLEKAAIVNKVEPLLDNASAAYSRLLAAAKDPASHWEAVNWCKTQKGGKLKYRNEINFHLRQIVRLDPNDTDAWRRITNSIGKPIYREVDGTWINIFERSNASGYVKSGGKWMSKEALRVMEQMDQSSNNELVVDAVNKWKDLVRDNKVGAASARLGQIIDESTVVPLFNFATGRGKRGKPKPQPEAIRSMVMEAIGTINTPQALNALVFFAVEDPNLDLRSRATTLLENDRLYNADDVARKVILSRYLQATSNLTINRAALLLQRIGSDVPIVALIEALETKHTEATGQRPGGMSVGQRGGNIEGLNAGGGKATREVYKTNERVLAALRTLSVKGDNQRVDFGYAKAAWKSWYIQKYKITEMNVRADAE